MQDATRSRAAACLGTGLVAACLTLAAGELAAQDEAWVAVAKGERTEVYVDPKTFDNYVGFYQRDQFKLYTVTRLGDRMYIQVTGREFLPVYPESPQKFFYKGLKVPAQVSFVTGPQGPATGLIVHQYGMEYHARRIEEAEAKALQEGFAKRLREPTPMSGSEVAPMEPESSTVTMTLGLTALLRSGGAVPRSTVPATAWRLSSPAPKVSARASPPARKFERKEVMVMTVSRITGWGPSRWAAAGRGKRFRPGARLPRCRRWNGR